MTILTNAQAPFVCTTLAEMGTLLTLYPSIPDMTQCYVRDDNDVYRLEAGAWIQTYPDPAMVAWLQANDIAITALQTDKVDKVSGKALSANDFTNALLAKLNGISDGATKNQVYQGTVLKANPIIYCNAAVVASGVAVFYLTTDGTAGGAALFPNGLMNASINTYVNDATASYQTQYALTNSNKTLTVTANKLTTANILTGLLGQTPANGSTVNLTVWMN